MKYFSPQAMNPAAHAKHDKRKRLTAGAMATGTWTTTEHNRFLAAIELFPQGPWKAIAKYVGTRTPRQAQTHAQKYREKLLRQDSRVPGGRSKACGQGIVKVEVEAVDVVNLTPHEFNTNCFYTQDFLLDPVLPMDDAMAFLIDLVDCAEWAL